MGFGFRMKYLKSTYGKKRLTMMFSNFAEIAKVYRNRNGYKASKQLLKSPVKGAMTDSLSYGNAKVA